MDSCLIWILNYIFFHPRFLAQLIYPPLEKKKKQVNGQAHIGLKIITCIRPRPGRITQIKPTPYTSYAKTLYTASRRFLRRKTTPRPLGMYGVRMVRCDSGMPDDRRTIYIYRISIARRDKCTLKNFAHPLRRLADNYHARPLSVRFPICYRFPRTDSTFDSASGEMFCRRVIRFGGSSGLIKKKKITPES